MRIPYELLSLTQVASRHGADFASSLIPACETQHNAGLSSCEPALFVQDKMPATEKGAKLKGWYMLSRAPPVDTHGISTSATKAKFSWSDFGDDGIFYDDIDSLGLGPLANSQQIDRHMDRIYNAVAKLIPIAGKTTSRVQFVGTLAEVKRHNLHVGPRKARTLLYGGLEAPIGVEEAESYDVVTLGGFSFSKRVGIVVPRTERELQRQITFYSGDKSTEYVIPEELRRVIRSVKEEF